MKTAAKRQRGIALVLALAFIVLLTIIAVAMSSMTSIERPAANAHFEKMRAAQLAQQGVENVVATLNRNITDPDVNWVSQPGRLAVSVPKAASASPTPNPPAVRIPLSTGTPPPSASPLPAYLQPAELNLPTLQDPTSHLITEATTLAADGTASAVPMLLNWVYITQDGTPSRVLQYDATAPAYVWMDNPKYAPNFSSNPIVGRYAYWTDDESSRINYNLAWGKAEVGNPNPIGDPTSVSLTALQNTALPQFDLTLSMANTIHGFITGNNYATINRYYNTPTDVRTVGQPDISRSLNHYKFDVTHYSHDPGTTFFNEPRIILTTRPDRAGWTFNTNPDYPNRWVGKNNLPAEKGGLPHYIRILANEAVTGGLLPQNPTPASGRNSNLNPGPLTSMDPTAVSDTVNLLLTYLQRQDWPMVSGASSFQDKYFSSRQNYNLKEGKLRLAQLAANIIDYVRSKESPDNIVPPLRLFSKEYSDGSLVYYNNFPPDPYASYMGSSRMPFITEVGCYYDPIAKKMTAVVEVYCPPNYGIKSVPMTSMALFIANSQTNGTVTGPNEQIGATGGGYVDTLSSPNLIPGGYVVINRAWDKGVYDIPTSLPLNWRIGLSIYDSVGNKERVDLIPLVIAGTNAEYNGYSLHVPFNMSVTTQAMVTSLQCDDPRINTHTGTWSSQPGGGNTFGAANNSQIVTLTTAPTTPAGIAQQDTDKSGLITDASFYMPSPAGTTTGSFPNPMGCVTSVGELGYIHTGIEGSNVAYADLADGNSVQLPLPKGTPWRTLRLQPNNYLDTSTVPDWALMDLFAAPIIQQNAKAIYAPHDTAVGGRVNLNSRAVPFDTAPTYLGHLLPIAAVLQGSVYDSASPSSILSPSASYALANNIYHQITTPLSRGNKGKMYGAKDGISSADTSYVSPGEVCEIQGVADQGESSEELVRRTVNLFTTRGGVFSVYSIGQALKQTPSGALVVTGEERVRTMLERYVPDPKSTNVSLRPVYASQVNP